MKLLTQPQFLSLLCAPCVLCVTLAAKPAPAGPEKTAAPIVAGVGGGMENCITAVTSNTDVTFTNNCSQNLNVTISGRTASWAPGLLRPGGSMTHDTGNGPFRWFACVPPAVAFDANNQTQWPNANSTDYICK